MNENTKEIQCPKCKGAGFSGVDMKESDMIEILKLIKCDFDGCKNGFIEIDLTKPKNDSYDKE